LTYLASNTGITGPNITISGVYDAIVKECKEAADDCVGNTEYQKIVFISKAWGPSRRAKSEIIRYENAYPVYLTPVKKTIPYIRLAPVR
jgi:hypothetical protein